VSTAPGEVHRSLKTVRGNGVEPVLPDLDRCPAARRMGSTSPGRGGPGVPALGSPQ